MKPMISAPQTAERTNSIFQGYFNEYFGGLARFADMENMTGDGYPLIRTRAPRYKVRKLTKCNGIFGAEKLGWVDGTYLYWDKVSRGSVTDSKKTFVNIGAYTVIFPDKKCLNRTTGALTDLQNQIGILATATTITYTSCDILGNAIPHDTAVYVKITALGVGIGTGFNDGDVVSISGSTAIPDGMYQLIKLNNSQVIVIATLEADTVTQTTGTLSVERTVPDMDFVCEQDNRIWGCSSAKHEIYACKLGDPTNWNCFQGLSTDSYAVTVGSTGDFTGAASHLGYVLFFKNDCIHKVYGNKPSNYQVTCSKVRGVMPGSGKSLVVMNETLYYLSETGEVAYEGALPEGISDAWGYGTGVKYKNAVSGAGFGKMWVSVVDAESETVMFTFDGEYGLWHKEDDTRATDFARTAEALYMTDDEGVIWRLEGDDNGYYDVSGTAGSEDAEEPLEWMIRTAWLEGEMLSQLHVQKIRLRIALRSGATAQVSMITDGVENSVAELTGVTRVTQTVYIIPQRCESFYLKISGTGHAEIQNLSYVFRQGTEYVVI